MPQILSRVCREPGEITLSPHVFKDKPEEAILVARIISTWASIEHELASMLMRMLGATEAVALAMFSALDAASARRAALNAAAKAAYEDNTEGYQVYLAVTGAAFGAGQKRHKAAHWLWGSCKGLPNTLLLADPDIAKRVDMAFMIEHGRAIDGDRPSVTTREEVDEYLAKFRWDTNRIYVYTVKDLQRDVSDLEEISAVMFWYRSYLRPMRTEEDFLRMKAEGFPHPHVGTSAEALRQLSKLRLYREAWDRIEKGTSSSPEPRP